MPAVGWRDILLRTKAEAKTDRATLLAAGVAFYALLALVPALVALVSVVGLVADPATIDRDVRDFLGAAPREVGDLVSQQLEAITADAGAGTVLAVLVGIALALWSASSGIGHLIEAINTAYDEEETRGFVERKVLALSLTVGAVVFAAVAFVLIAALPGIVADTGLGIVGRILLGVLRWALLVAGMLAATAVLYRVGPDRDDARWAWITPGAVVATVLWISGSAIFAIYTANFGKYNETYGSLGGVVVVMLWLFLTAFSVILGAELNAESEKQTSRDSTVGAARPLGWRRATAADTVAPAPASGDGE
ncbi:MAG: YihY/virulence factor BrkB family protein [Acidimicrobiia bacterium]|nr:YihY/virulence factor BrkB family protein [Acidimicrobiia bacterium]